MASNNESEFSLESLMKKYSHILQYFELSSAVKRSDGILEFSFRCCLCIKKEFKKSSRVSLSNRFDLRSSIATKKSLAISLAFQIALRNTIQIQLTIFLVALGKISLLSAKLISFIELTFIGML